MLQLITYTEYILKQIYFQTAFPHNKPMAHSWSLIAADKFVLWVCSAKIIPQIIGTKGVRLITTLSFSPTFSFLSTRKVDSPSPPDCANVLQTVRTNISLTAWLSIRTLLLGFTYKNPWSCRGLLKWLCASVDARFVYNALPSSSCVMVSFLFRSWFTRSRMKLMLGANGMTGAIAASEAGVASYLLKHQFVSNWEKGLSDLWNFNMDLKRMFCLPGTLHTGYSMFTHIRML